MKKTISIILIFIFILAIIARVVRVQADTVMVSLNLNKTAVETGDTFTATLFATCADEINGVITSFSYDTDKLELISESVGTDFASLGENNNIELIASKAGITEANVYTLEFKAKETIEEVTTATVSLSDITVSPMTGDDTTLAGISKSITINPATINVSATKQYDDNNNQDGIREDAKFDLYKKVGQGQNTLVANSTKTISKDATGDGLVATWNDIPKYENGIEIEYSVEEELTNVVTGTDAPGTYKVEKTGDYKTGITIKNTHTPETINVSATKQYNDNNNQDGIREDAKFDLYKKVGQGQNTLVANSTKTISKDATGEGLVATWGNLPKYENGVEIEYSVEEELTNVVTGADATGTYKVEKTGDYKTGITIKNTHTPQTNQGGGNTTPSGGTTDGGNTTPTGGTTDTGNTTPTGGTTDTGNTTPTGGTIDTGNTTPTGGTIDTGNTTPTGGTTDTGNTTPSSNASYDETTNTVRNINSDLNKNKSSKSSSKLPYTGTQQIIIWTILVVSGIAGVMYVLNRKYRGI